MLEQQIHQALFPMIPKIAPIAISRHEKMFRGLRFGDAIKGFPPHAEYLELSLADLAADAHDEVTFG